MRLVPRTFVPRSVFARRYGIFGASMLSLGSVYGGRIPKGVKVACLIDGDLKEARYGEASHRDICQREAILGSTVVDGFSFESTSTLS